MTNGHPLTHDLLVRLGILNGMERDRLKEITREYQQELVLADDADEGHPGGISSTNQAPIGESQLWPSASNDRNRPSLDASKTLQSTIAFWQNDVHNDQKPDDAQTWFGEDDSYSLFNEVDPTKLSGYADASLKGQQNALTMSNTRLFGSNVSSELATDFIGYKYSD